jgi:hypothetical protein
MENNQTAVEWLVANIDWLVLKNCPWQYEMLIKKAKEMERDQIIDAHDAAYIAMNLAFRGFDRSVEYYENTYGNELNP